jgi:hypothetical protein
VVAVSLVPGQVGKEGVDEVEATQLVAVGRGRHGAAQPWCMSRISVTNSVTSRNSL